MRQDHTQQETTSVDIKRPADILEAVLGAVYADTRHRDRNWTRKCLKVMKEFKLDAGVAVGAFEELEGAGILNQPSLRQRGGPERWRVNYAVMMEQLGDEGVRRRLRLKHLMV